MKPVQNLERRALLRRTRALSLATLVTVNPWSRSARSQPATATALGSPSAIDLGVAAQYSGFFFGRVSRLPHIEGRLAVAGDINLSGTSIGERAPPGLQASLVVGGNVVRYTGGFIHAGSLDSHGVYAGNLVLASHFLDLRKQASPIDFAAEQVYLCGLSEQLRAMAPTGSVSKLWSTVTLKGSGRDLEVFALSAEQVASGLNLQLDGIKPGASLILNVGCNSQRQLLLGIEMAVLKPFHGRVLVHAPDVDVLRMVGIRVEASVLAPFACVKDSSGHLEGSVIAASWDSSMDIGYGPFIGA